MPVPRFHDERGRLDALRALEILDTPREQAFDDITELAAQICGTPIALVSFVADERQWFKSCHGLDASETPIAQSFCAYAVADPRGPFIVPDARRDPRFADNPLVVGPPHIRFYAGMPLVVPSGVPLGTLCVIDREPRELAAEQLAALERLARLVVVQLGARELAQEHTREAVRREQERLATVVNGLKEVVFETDAVGLWTYLNPAWTEITGFHLDESLGRPFFEFLHPDDVELNRQRFAPLIERKKDHCRHEIRYKTVDGGFRWIEVHARLLLTPEDQIAGTTGTLRDITEQKAMAAELVSAREEALQASRLKSEFLANMSHEIRTPINGVLGLTTLLLDTPLNTEQREFAEGVTQSAEALLGVINDVLDLSKIEAGRLDIELLPFDITRLLAQVRETVGVKARLKGLDLEVHCAGDLPSVVIGDAGRLRQVLLNLADNAVKFTSVGYVTIDAARHFTHDGDERLRFTVRDTGMGIPASKLRSIFDKFSQADSTTARRFGGTGLGLAICRQLVSLMGGAIAVTSVEAEGATFTFDVPLRAWSEAPVPGVQAATVRRRAEGVDATPKHVLLVEDNPINQKVASRFLAKEGCVVDVADDGPTALERVNSQLYDAVFMDCQLPGMDGYQTTQLIRQLQGYEQVPIIGVTAHAMVGDREKCLAAGMTDYLAKPLHPDDVHAALLRAADAMPARDESGGVGGGRHMTAQFDAEIVLTAFDGDVNDIRELVALVSTSLPRYVNDLVEAAGRGDAKTVAALAHTIRGSVGNVGAVRLAGLARDVESTARAGGVLTGRPVEALQTASHDLVTALGQWATSLG